MSSSGPTPSGGMPRPAAPLLAGRYRLGERKGRAGDTAVHEAFDEQLQRTVIVRMLHPELSARLEVRQRFRTTMTALAALHHPHVATLHDWGAAEWRGRQVLYTVTEHLNGGTLRDALDRGRQLSPSQALVVGLDACKALVALHRAGIVHGDVRPATIAFGDDRRLRLVDAGLSVILTDAHGGVESLSNDIVKYVSPERATGGAAEPASDVYSLCLSLVESITGAVPFVGDSPVATLANRVDRLLPVSADFGPLAAVLERAGRPNPTDRATAAEFGRGLVEVAPGMAKPAPLPILANTRVRPDPARPGEPVEPSGPMRRPRPQGDPSGGVASTATGEMPVTRTIGISTDPAAGPITGQLRRTGGQGRVQRPTARQSAPTQVITAMPVDEVDPPGWWTTPRGRRGLIGGIVAAALLVGGLGWFFTRPPQVVVTDVTGFEVARAINDLADFDVEQVEIADDVIPAGSVVRTEPAAGSSAASGSTITVFVSIGPRPRVLPELNGLTIDEAQAKLLELGLVAIVGEPSFNEVVEEGRVLSWTVVGSPSLTAGDAVLKGASVELVVSAGRAPREVPDLSGLGYAAAEAKLKALDLVIQRADDVFSDTVPAGSVAGQDPAPGTELTPGSVVTVSVSKGPDLVEFPSLSGLTAEQMVAALQELGFVVKTGGNTSNALSYSAIDSTIVGAGSKVPRGSEVVLVFEG